MSRWMSLLALFIFVAQSQSIAYATECDQNMVIDTLPALPVGMSWTSSGESREGSDSKTVNTRVISVAEATETGYLLRNENGVEVTQSLLLGTTSARDSSGKLLMTYSADGHGALQLPIGVGDTYSNRFTWKSGDGRRRARFELRMTAVRFEMFEAPGVKAHCVLRMEAGTWRSKQPRGRQTMLISPEFGLRVYYKYEARDDSKFVERTVTSISLP